MKLDGVKAVSSSSMVSYIECCGCGRQWKLVGDIEKLQCTCGEEQVNIEAGFGAPPAWWKGETP